MEYKDIINYNFFDKDWHSRQANDKGMVAQNLINRQLKIIWVEYKVNDIIGYEKALKQFQKIIQMQIEQGKNIESIGTFRLNKQTIFFWGRYYEVELNV